MNSQILDSIKEALSDITVLTPDKLQELVQDTVVAFQLIQAKVSSKDGAEREEGLKVAAELKAAMEDQVQKLQTKLGMNAEQIDEYLANPANFSKAELKLMDESKQDLEHFKKQINAKDEAPIRKRKNKKQLFIVS